MPQEARREEILASYLALCETGDPAKVNVSRLAEFAGISRKTFYYYFPSREALDILLFRRDIAALLGECYTDDELVYNPDDAGELARLPYYARRVVAPRRMDNAEFFLCLSKCFDGRHRYYASMLKDGRTGGLSDYLFKLYRNALREDADTILAGCGVGPDALDHIADWMTHAFLDEMASWMATGRPAKERRDIAPFLNIQHDILSMYAERALAGGYEDASRGAEASIAP